MDYRKSLTRLPSIETETPATVAAEAGAKGDFSERLIDTDHQDRYRNRINKAIVSYTISADLFVIGYAAVNRVLA